MKIKNSYFLQCIPGLPVYELMDGTLMIPFQNKETKGWYWYSEKEVTKRVSDMKTLEGLRRPYHLAKAEINKLNIKVVPN